MKFLRHAACACLAVTACVLSAVGADNPPSSTGVPSYTFTIVAIWPHDTKAFTEGLVYLDGGFIESTGLNGSSTLRKVDLRTGRVVREIALAGNYFGEGAAVLGDKVYQLTWRERTCFVYDLATFRKLGEFSYEGEGWGLTTDGKSLIMSDGTDRIRFLDPATFRVVRSIQVSVRGRPLAMLNELEYVRGEIYANVWQTDTVVRIDPSAGRVTGIVDFSGLLPREDYTAGTDVLNGIAYDPASDRLFVTGKDWPKLFEVRLRPK